MSSLSEGLDRSRWDTMPGAAGHSIAAIGSSQAKPCSSVPSYSFETRYIRVMSVDARKPWATPAGIYKASPADISTTWLTGGSPRIAGRTSVVAATARPSMSNHRSACLRWKCIPRSTPARERDRLAWTMGPVSRSRVSESRHSSVNEPRSSACASLRRHQTPSTLVGCQP